METTEQVTITEGEAATLNKARVVLKQIEARMWDAADTRRVGLALRSTVVAENAIFQTLVVMRAYMGADLSDEQMFL